MPQMDVSEDMLPDLNNLLEELFTDIRTRLHLSPVFRFAIDPIRFLVAVEHAFASVAYARYYRSARARFSAIHYIEQ